MSIQERTPGTMLAYYDSPTGPRVLLRTHSLRVLTTIRDIFRSLAMGDMREATDRDLLVNTMIDTSGLRLVRSNTFVAGPPTVSVLDGEEARDPVCVWTQDAEGWLRAAEMTQSMVEGGGPCHQHFEGRDADIELSFMEYPEASGDNR